MHTTIPAIEMSNCAPPVTAKLAPWMQRFLRGHSLASSLTQAYGSPLHVFVGEEFLRNASDLLEPLRTRGIAGGLYFARKANKLPWFVSLAKQAGIGVDTASFEEVKETLALGVPPEQVIVTAVGKTRALVELACAAGCLLVVENLDELELIAQVAAASGKTARIGLRFAGFKIGERQVYSRFGLPLADAEAIFKKVAAQPFLGLELLHAHLDRYDIEERALAGTQLVELSDRARKHNLTIRAIDLGGGIVMRYLDSPGQWDHFQSELQAAVMGKRPSFTFADEGFGYQKIGETLAGKADLYPAWNPWSKERMVRAILDYPQAGSSLAKELNARKLGLYFEPGRALLDNTGMTIAQVAFRKHDTLGNLLVGLSMNRFNLRPFRAEFCSDPLVLAPAPRQVLTGGAFLVGSLCAESDIIMRRRLALPFLPEPGDIVCFANTAGYLAHHLEIGTHGNPLPANVLIDPHMLAVRQAHPQAAASLPGSTSEMAIAEAIAGA